jgi:myosin-7
LALVRGDLLVADAAIGDVSTQPWTFGECVRTGTRGHIPVDSVYILPTLTKPSVDVMVGAIRVCPSLIGFHRNCSTRVRT